MLIIMVWWGFTWIWCFAKWWIIWPTNTNKRRKKITIKLRVTRHTSNNIIPGFVQNWGIQVTPPIYGDVRWILMINHGFKDVLFIFRQTYLGHFTNPSSDWRSPWSHPMVPRPVSLHGGGRLSCLEKLGWCSGSNCWGDALTLHIPKYEQKILVDLQVSLFQLVVDMIMIWFFYG